MLLWLLTMMMAMMRMMSKMLDLKMLTHIVELQNLKYCVLNNLVSLYCLLLVLSTVNDDNHFVVFDMLTLVLLFLFESNTRLNYFRFHFLYYSMNFYFCYYFVSRGLDFEQFLKRRKNIIHPNQIFHRDPNRLNYCLLNSYIRLKS